MGISYQLFNYNPVLLQWYMHEAMNPSNAKNRKHWQKNLWFHNFICCFFSSPKISIKSPTLTIVYSENLTSMQCSVQFFDHWNCGSGFHIAVPWNFKNPDFEGPEHWNPSKFSNSMFISFMRKYIFPTMSINQEKKKLQDEHKGMNSRSEETHLFIHQSHEEGRRWEVLRWCHYLVTL